MARLAVVSALRRSRYRGPYGTRNRVVFWVSLRGSVSVVHQPVATTGIVYRQVGRGNPGTDGGIFGASKMVTMDHSEQVEIDCWTRSQGRTKQAPGGATAYGGLCLGSEAGHKRRMHLQEIGRLYYKRQQELHYGLGIHGSTTASAPPQSRRVTETADRSLSAPFLIISPDRQRRRDWFRLRWVCARKTFSQPKLQCTSAMWRSTARHTFDEVDY